MQTYRIEISGHLDARWSDWFDVASVKPQASGNTIIEARIRDQAELFGIVLRIRDLGLQLLSVRTTDKTQNSGDTTMQTKTFARPEGTIEYDDYGGNGDVVLMFPGMGALRSEYRLLAPKVSEAGFRAVVADLRGHGGSSSNWSTYDVPSVGQDILGLIDHLGVDSAHLIGTSFSPGSMVWAAAEAPERIKSLTLIGAFVRDVKINPMMQGLMWLMMNNPWRVRSWRAFYPTMFPSRKPDDFGTYLDELTNNLKEKGRFDAVKGLAAASRKPSETRLPKVQSPTLVVMGTADPDFPDPVVEAHYIVEQTGGQLTLIEGAGHYPQTEMPDVTNPQIVQFLQSVN